MSGHRRFLRGNANLELIKGLTIVYARRSERVSDLFEVGQELIPTNRHGIPTGLERIALRLIVGGPYHTSLQESKPVTKSNTNVLLRLGRIAILQY